LSILRIFVSYRRGDSGHAGRLYDALASRFGSGNVFMDIDTIDPGVDFAEVINRAVSSCDVVIALIGRGWVDATDAEGRRRLDDADDFVRLELESALAREIVVIPALVQGAEIPHARELPPSLVPLTRRQGIALRDIGWHDDVGRLIRRLERLAEGATEGETPSPPPIAAATARPLWRRRKLLLPVGVLVAALATLVAALAVRGSDDGSTSSAQSRLLAFIPPVTRSTCQHISWGEKIARASVGCSGARLSATYNLFASNSDMSDWYTQRREQEQIEPGSGRCAADAFRGEARYTGGRYLCFVASDGESHLVWSDERVGVGAEANIYEGKGRVASQSLLRQWRCCLQLQP
jgi:hypothetical protein